MSKEFTREEKLKYMRMLMWDYHYPPEECLEVLEGKRKTVGHYTEETLFRKLLESFPWFTIIRLLPLERIKELLTENVIQKLRFNSLKKSYAFIRERLQENISHSG
jgi:hypothetical protein